MLGPIQPGHARRAAWAPNALAELVRLGAVLVGERTIFASNNRLLSPKVRTWLVDGICKSVSPQGKHRYGIGVRIDPVVGGRMIISHTGAWPWTQLVAKDGPLVSSTGAYVVRYPDGTSLFCAFWPIPRDVAECATAYNKLADAMRRANEKARAGSRAAR